MQSIIARLKKHWVIVVVAVLLVLGGTIGTVYVLTEKNVEVAVDGQILELASRADTVGELLQEHDIALNEQDEVAPQVDTKLTDGAQVTVTRAVTVNVTADWKTQQLITVPVTVREVLHKSSISLGALDIVSPALDEVVSADTQVVVKRVVQKERTEEVITQAKTVRKEDASLEKGITKTLSRGQSGKEQVTYRVTYTDGALTGKEIVEEKVISKAKDKIVAYGTLTTASRGGRDFSFDKALKVKAYAYTGGGRTASGVPAKVGVIAVDPRVIPLGSRLYVEGYGYCVAGDTGGNIKGNTIDVYLDSEKSCVRWGVKYVKVYVLQ